ncbi:substrate-binding domain-containing protein [Agromyces bauzanensis]
MNMQHHKAVRSTSAVGAFVAVGVALAGCSGGSPSASGTEGAPASQDGYTIAYLAQGTTNSWAAQMDAIMSTVAEESGEVKQLLYFDAAGDANTQLGQFETALAQKPDAMIVTPLGKTAAAGPIERATAAGVPVVLCASGVDTEDYVTQVAPNTYEASRASAEWLVEQLGGEGTVAVVDGIPGVDTSELMGAALRDVLEENPGVTIVNEGYGNFSVSESKSLSQTFLASGKKIDAWWGSGGESATGIMSALVDADLSEMPPVAGATLSNGVLRMSIESGIPLAAAQFPATMAAECFDAAIAALSGEDLPKFIDITALPGNENIFGDAVNDVYAADYADDYVYRTDEILSREQLEELNLVR